MAEWWATNWEKVIAVAGALIGVIGLYFGVKGWKRKKPYYLICSNNIFKGLEHTIPDVEVKFPGYGQPVKSLTVTKIAFWNAGNETIKKQDVVKEDQITIRGKDGVVFLSSSIIDVVSPHNKLDCKLNQDRSIVTITFEYLDHNQGGNIQVFHTGVSNADIFMQGTIIGGSPIRRKGRSMTPQPPLWQVMVPIGVLWFIWVLAAFGLLPKHDPMPPPQDTSFTAETFGVFLAIVSLLYAIMIYFARIPKPFSNVLRQ